MNLLFILSGDNPYSLVTPDPGLVFWTVIIFIILWSILGKFAFKPIANALKEREESIEDSLHQAEKAREEMQQLTAKNEELLKQAREEKSKMIREAKETANKILEDAKEKSKEQASRILDDANRDIENAKQAALVDVKNQVGQMAIEISEKILRKELSSKEDQEKYVTSLVDDAQLN